MAKPDPLRKRIYAWEDSFKLQVGEIPWGKLRYIHRQACNYYHVPAIRVLPAPKDADTSFYYLNGKAKAIYLLDKHKMLDVLLHETAHYISDYYLGHNRPHHDKNFIQTYMWLLLKMKAFKEPFLRASLRPFGLRLNPLSPEALRNA